MRKIRLANILTKIWFYLIMLIGFFLLIRYPADEGVSILINILLMVFFYKIIQFLFKPLKLNERLFSDYLKGNNVEEYSKNKTWVMICTVLITLLFILPTFGLILSLTITQFMSLSKQKSIIV